MRFNKLYMKTTPTHYILVKANRLLIKAIVNIYTYD